MVKLRNRLHNRVLNLIEVMIYESIQRTTSK